MTLRTAVFTTAYGLTVGAASAVAELYADGTTILYSDGTGVVYA